jgi:hypothetical protein
MRDKAQKLSATRAGRKRFRDVCRNRCSDRAVRWHQDETTYPLINHKNVCDYLTRSGDEIIALLNEVSAGLDDAAQKLHQECERLCLELEERLKPKIERLIERYAMDNRQYLSHCARVWEDEIATSKTALLEQVQQGFDQLTLNLNQLDVIDEAIPGFEKRTERIALTHVWGKTSVKPAGRPSARRSVPSREASFRVLERLSVPASAVYLVAWWAATVAAKLERISIQPNMKISKSAITAWRWR